MNIINSFFIKLYMKNKFLNIAYLLIAIGILGISCEKAANFKTYTYPAQVPSGMSPVSGFPTTNVTITGTNFDTLKVWFGGILATTVVSNNGTQIVVQVPANAVSGKVSLQVWTTKVDSIGTFTVLLPLPVIKSVFSKGIIAPVVAASGDTVLIKGSGFLTDPLKVAVDFNGTIATNIVSLKDTIITVIAPSGYSAGNVNVTFFGLKVVGSALSPILPTGDISVYFLANYTQPFTGIVAGDASRWRTPAAWTVTAPIMNHNGANSAPAGGLDNNHPPMYLGCEAGWGAPAITDGKMYQTITLPAGSYTYSVGMSGNGFTNTNNYIVAASGTTIPNAANVSTALGYTNITPHNANAGAALSATISCNFTLTQATQVSLGLLVNLGSGGEYINFLWVKLVKN
jgi:hypothetical protein